MRLRPPRLRLRHAFLAVIAMLLAGHAQADSLRYRVQGVDKAALENIRAFLGDAPQDEPAAERFLSSAERKTADALQAIGYYDARIELNVDRERDPWLATISVTPGEPLRYTRVEAELQGEAAKDSELSALLAARAPKVGDTVHHGRYEALKQALDQMARRRGYFDARFIDRRIELDVGAREAALILRYDSGQRFAFGEMELNDPLIDPQLLQRLSPFKPGDGYQQQLLLELRQRLLRLGYFGSATVLPDLGRRAYPSVPVQVSLIPAPRHSFELGVGYSTDTRQRLSLNWQTPRINRFGHSQETVLRWSPVNPQARVTYSIPLDDPANDVLQLIGRLENNEFGDLESEQREFRIRREQTRGGLVRGVQLRSLHEQWGVFSSNFDAAFVLAGASVSSRSRRGNVVDPSRGLSQFYSIELASEDAGSDEDLLRLYGSVTALHSLGEQWRVVGRAEAGTLWTQSDDPERLPPSLAFFAGGDNSLRGFAYQSVGREVGIERFDDPDAPTSLVVGGSRLLTASLELQHYFTDTWRGALFVDAGDAFDSGDFNTNVGIGFGVHYLSPVGALRLEIANPVTSDEQSWRIHINIGAEF